MKKQLSIAEQIKQGVALAFFASIYADHGWIYNHSLLMGAVGADRELSPELFGNYLATQAMVWGLRVSAMLSVRVSKCLTLSFGAYDLTKDYFI